MYQVTAIYCDCEVGYGEGESLSYAIIDAMNDFDSIYESVQHHFTYRVIGGRFPAMLDAQTAMIMTVGH